MKFKLIIALIASTLLVGCASSPKMQKYDSEHSDAWNLAWPADIKIADVKVPKNGPVAPERGLVGATTAGTLTYLKPPPGFSPGIGAGLSALAWLTEQERVSQRSRIVAWVPESLAKTSDEAAQVFYELATKALQDAINEVGLPQPYTLVGFDEGYGISSRYFFRSYHGVISGDECSGKVRKSLDEKILQCAIGFFISGRDSGNPGLNTTKDVAPEIIGGHPAWRVTATIDRGHIDSRNGPQEWKPRFPEVEIFTEFSKKLPDWSYVYIAPGITSIKNDDGKFRFLMFPLVIRQGEPLYFIRPET